ncbi:MAG: HypC/HybG/HupF family hydrogenase formation chaperone, partial [Candidatus Cloacimonetes bacterium]|nr:HypC/HybG/HupF family hydrogenase formation chaperone [Candidatus Cloacimonadota bacterium]
RKQIALTFVPEAEVGDWILIHTGFGLNIISEAEALETLELIKQAYGLEEISEPAADS